MHREVGTAIGSTGKIDPLPRTRRRWNITHAIVKDIESQTAITGPIVEMIGVEQEHLKHGEPVDHRIEGRTEFGVIDGIRHRRLDADLAELIEIRGPGRVLEVVRERPEATIIRAARTTRFELEFVDAQRPKPPLLLMDPPQGPLVVHRLAPGPTRT